MKFTPKYLLTIIFCLQALLFNHPAQAQNQDGFVDLIDGVSLTDWNIIGTANWVIGNGIVEGNKPNGFLVSTKSYKNFVIKTEFWAESNTNSGIFIRCQDPKKVTQSTCYEINIWDTRPEQAYATGAIVDVAKVDPVPKAGGRWNTMEITANGSHFKVVLNGVTTVADGQDSRYADGPIALQSAGGIIKFKKVQIKTL
ncbi:3-keto-disaccharide hydrolase [Polynucleobacter asymbioticus]|uniref:3-keto-alpha-glucoside-1,2-lyase/3-keto-2-hydroxy-glucal hydratase domain-containing protein n=1 Tax=Polynucleobacter asymbioticus TaxID=576611 RepID=A0AAC9NIE5_9BURK|nr:DUF1080 domain-containing protein [Polynucleobacter asymbioticus]APB98971.1 hypothetical protein A4F89_06345 [Polynucleobacter asymbioticus]APC01273.1 hypothetical protein AOC25_06445 [Polynucleobacter asymbioticus]